ncbi:hypothetical protein H4Q26_009080 [Puccinia striiformis f. sp. tritici PST-130]|nr:hypothetical protein H4Q26_009080 [Puccinia striiformis f. sp. tritici PST-130]
MSPQGSSTRYNPIGWLSDLQERPLLTLRFNPLQTPNYKGRSTCGSKLVLISSLVILIVTIVFIDRQLFRNLNEPHLLWDTNYHLTNAIVARVCNLIPSSGKNNSTFQGLIESKLCLNN